MTIRIKTIVRLVKLASSKLLLYPKIFDAWIFLGQNMSSRSSQSLKESLEEPIQPTTSDLRFLKSSTHQKWVIITQNSSNMDSLDLISLSRKPKIYQKDKTQWESCHGWKETTQSTTIGEELDPITLLMSVKEADKIVSIVRRKLQKKRQRKLPKKFLDLPVETAETWESQVKSFCREGTAETPFAPVAETAEAMSEAVGISEAADKELTKETDLGKEWKISEIAADNSSRELEPWSTRRRNKSSSEIRTYQA